MVTGFLIVCLVLTTTVSIVGTVFNLRIEDEAGGLKRIRPLGWTFITLSIVLLTFSILLARYQLLNETEGRKTAEKRADDLARRYEVGMRRVRVLAVRVMMKGPMGDEAQQNTMTDGASYLIPPSIETGEGVDYNFHQSLGRGNHSRHTVAVDICPHDQPKKCRSYDLGWISVKYPGQPSAEQFGLEFPFSTKLDDLSSGTKVGDFDGAQLTFSHQLGPPIPTIVPKRIARVLIVANPGTAEIKFACFEVAERSWHAYPDLELLNLQMHRATISLPAVGECQPYPPWQDY
jgi:hypothetical protein